MTDHLTEARACLSRVDLAATHFSAAGWLTATCQHILDHLEAQQTEASLRRGLADITAGRTVDLGSFAQPEPEQLGGSNFMAWMADRLADPEVLAGYLAAHAREVREQVAGELHYEAKAMTRFNAHPAMSDAAATAAAYREGIRDGLTAAAHIACAEQTTARQDADLTASQGETGHEDQYETDFNRWLDSLSPGQRKQITRDIEAAHDLIRAEAWDEAVDTLSGPWEDMIPAQIADLDRRNPYRKEQP